MAKSFTVTPAAMRPNSVREECFYCQQPIGHAHAATCVLIQRPVRVRMLLEYDIMVPASWGRDAVDFHRNEQWCASNLITELQAFDGEDRCLCNVLVHSEFLQVTGCARLKEA